MATPLGSDHAAVYEWLRAAEQGAFAGKGAGGGPPAYAVSTIQGGPAFVDWNRTRRAPSPVELTESWRQLCFGCSVLNANAVSRQPLRLYVGTGHSQHRPKTFGPLRPSRIAPRTKSYLRSKAEFKPFLKGADEIDEVNEHPLLTLFGEVNPAWDHIRLIRYIVLCLDVIGRAHLLPGDERGKPTPGRRLPPFLWPLMAQYVYPYRDTEGSLPTRYQYFGESYDPEDLVSFRGDSFRDPYASGQSPTQAAFAFVGLSDSFTAMMETMMTQAIRPSVIVTNKDADEPMGDPERRRLQREINYQLSGGGAGKAWVVDGALDVKTLNFPPTSLAENEISNTAVQYVAYIFGIPLSFIRNEDSNRAVSEAGHYQHAILGVEPRCVNIASCLTKWTHAEGRRRGVDWSRLVWAFDNPVKEDEEREAKIWDIDIKNGSRVVNERRLHLGYDARPWGDEPWFSNALVQPSVADAERKAKDDLAQRQFAAQWGPGEDEGETPEAEGQEDAGTPDGESPGAAAGADAQEQATANAEEATRGKGVASLPDLAATANILLARVEAELEEKAAMMPDATSLDSLTLDRP